MKINTVNNTDFRAKFVNKAYIGKLAENSNGLYLPHQVSFIKIDPFRQSDINELKMCAKYWENANLATNIYYAACALRNKSKFYQEHEVYALTTQKYGFRHIDNEKILGLIHICPYFDGSTFIEQIQANPKIIYSLVPEFKGIGTAILDSLKHLTDKITCFPSHNKSTIDFYTRNGFNKHPSLMDGYLWKSR